MCFGAYNIRRVSNLSPHTRGRRGSKGEVRLLVSWYERLGPARFDYRVYGYRFVSSDETANAQVLLNDDV